MLISINHLLDKFKNLAKEKREEKKIIAKIIKDVSGVSIETESIVLNGSTITVHCHSVLKSEIFLKKESIIKILNQELASHNFEELL